MFNFFLNFAGEERSKAITFPIFEKGVVALTSERFKKAEIQRLWKQMASEESPDLLDRYKFREHFESMSYKGNSTVGSLSSLGQSTTTSLRSTN